jgi:hypothetical protein
LTSCLQSFDEGVNFLLVRELDVAVIDGTRGFCRIGKNLIRLGDVELVSMRITVYIDPRTELSFVGEDEASHYFFSSFALQTSSPHGFKQVHSKSSSARIQKSQLKPSLKVSTAE